MADNEDDGVTAREAVERYCKDWTSAGYLQCFPRSGPNSRNATDDEKAEAHHAAADELQAMLCHELPEDEPWDALGAPRVTGDQLRARINARLKKQLKKKRRKKAIDDEARSAAYVVMMKAPDNPEQFSGTQPVPLWTTGRRYPVNPDVSPESLVAEMWKSNRGPGFLEIDIEANEAAGGGLRYVDLRIYDSRPAPSTVAATPSASTKRPPARNADRLKSGTLKKYEAWYDRAQVLRKGNGWPSGKLATKIAEHFKKDELNRAKSDSIQRQLNKHFPGWAG